MSSQCIKFTVLIALLSGCSNLLYQMKSGFDDTQTQEWQEAGFDNPREARQWAKHGFLPLEAKAWRDRGFAKPEVYNWKKIGASPAQAKSLSEMDISWRRAKWFMEEGLSLNEVVSGVPDGSSCTRQTVHSVVSALNKHAAAIFDGRSEFERAEEFENLLDELRNRITRGLRAFTACMLFELEWGGYNVDSGKAFFRLKENALHKRYAIPDLYLNGRHNSYRYFLELSPTEAEALRDRIYRAKAIVKFTMIKDSSRQDGVWWEPTGGVIILGKRSYLFAAVSK